MIFRSKVKVTKTEMLVKCQCINRVMIFRSKVKVTKFEKLVEGQCPIGGIPTYNHLVIKW